jgi:aryl carrier-like protein
LKTKTHKEAALTSIWEKLLETTPIGPEDNFFDLGGHSLLLARLSREIKEQMGTSVTIVDLFRYPTIAAMAQHLSRVQTQKH